MKSLSYILFSFSLCFPIFGQDTFTVSDYDPNASYSALSIVNRQADDAADILFYQALKDLASGYHSLTDETDFKAIKTGVLQETTPTGAPTAPPADTTPPDTDGDGVSDLPPDDDEGTEDSVTYTASGLSSASDEAFVRQQYLDFLGRDADDSGLSYWLLEMSAGTKTRADVVNFFVFSDEFQNQVAPVSRLYQAYFLRIPDTSGLSYWISQKLAGVTIEEISNTFSTVDEFTNMYGPKTDAEFVQLVYQNVLGRQPDDSGLSYWVDDRLGQGESRGTVMIGFSESVEYQTTTLNNIRVIAFYYGMLRRAPDSEGFSYWVAKLDAGEQPNDLINGFIASAEYQGRF